MSRCVRTLCVSLCSNVLVYKLGGTSLELTVIAVCGGMYRIVSTYYDATMGGGVIDHILAEHFAAEFQRFVFCGCGKDVLH